MKFEVRFRNNCRIDALLTTPRTGLDYDQRSKRGCLVSTLVVNVGEASRGLRIHVKESETKTNANKSFALAA